jgi:WD40 repeat protein
MELENEKQLRCRDTSCLDSESSSNFNSMAVSYTESILLPISEYTFPSSSVLSSLRSDLFSHSRSSFQSVRSNPSLRFLFNIDSTYGQSVYRCISAIKIRGVIGVFSLAVMRRSKYNSVLYSGSYEGIQAWQLHRANSELYPLKYVCRNYGAVKAISIVGDKIFSAHYKDHKIRVWKYSQKSDQRHKLVCRMPSVQDCLKNLIRPENYVKVRRHKKCLWIQHVDAISSLAATKDGLVLYSASWDRTVKVWRLSQSQSVCVESFRAHDDAINAIAVSHDGFVYTASADCKIKVWKKCKTEHALVSTLEKHKSSINALALSSDGSVLYSGGCDRAIIIWERQTIDTSKPFEHEHQMCASGLLRGHMQAILCVAIVNPELVCSGSSDRTVRIWRRELGDCQSYCLAVLKGHSSPVKSITACADEYMGYVIYSGSLDGEIRTWVHSSSKDI